MKGGEEGSETINKVKKLAFPYLDLDLLPLLFTISSHCEALKNSTVRREGKKTSSDLRKDNRKNSNKKHKN